MMVVSTNVSTIGSTDVSMVVSTVVSSFNHSKVWKHYFDFVVSLKNFVGNQYHMVINQYIDQQMINYHQ